MLDRGLVTEVLAAARRKGGDFAEVFVEERSSTSIRLDDGQVEELTTGLDRGAGCPRDAGNELRVRVLEQAGPRRPAGSRRGRERGAPRRRPGHGRRPDRPVRARDQPCRAAPPIPWPLRTRSVGSARSTRSRAGVSPEVTQVTGIYFDSLQRRLIAASDGRWIDEERPRIRLVAQVVAKRGDVIQTGWDGPAACAGVEFLDAHPPRVTAERAATRAVTMLDSIPAPAGEMAVVVANGCGGVLFHEAVGHPLEADAVDKEASVYRGARRRAVRERVDRRCRRRHDRERLGFVRFRRRRRAGPTDRAVPRRRPPGLPPGPAPGREDGRRTHRERPARVLRLPPIVRMTNTNILPGRRTRTRSSVRRRAGSTSAGSAAGRSIPATGDFVFGVSEGYLIEDGHVTTPVRGANLIGRAIEVMSSVDAGRERLRDLGRRLRQGRPGRAGRERLADAPDRPRSRSEAPVPELGALVHAAVEAADGDEQVEAYAEEGRQTEVSALRDEVEGMTFAESRGLGVRVIRDGRLGYAWAADPSEDEARETVWRARENAALAEPDEHNGLPGGGAVRGDARALPRGERDRRCRRQGADGVGARGVRRLPRSARDEGRPGAGRGRGLARGDRLDDGGRRRVRADGRLGRRGHARGRRRRDPDRVLLRDRRAGSTRSTWEPIADEAVERAVQMLGAVKPPTAKLPVVLDPFAASSFLGVLAGALNAENVLKGRSLVRRHGRDERSVPSAFTLVDDGRRLDGPGACPFDDEGVPSGRTELFTRRNAERVPPRHVHGAPRRRRPALDRQRQARRLPVDAGRRHVELLRRGRATLVVRRAPREGRGRRADHGRVRACTRARTRSAASSASARPGCADRGRGARRAAPRDDDRLDPARDARGHRARWGATSGSSRAWERRRS